MKEALIRWAFPLQVGATLFMAGACWYVQVVHYPIFNIVGENEFAYYTASNMWRSLVILGPAMAVEGATAFLLIQKRPEWLPRFQALLGLGVLMVAWISTGLIQFPIHYGFSSDGFSASDYEWLNLSNWIRTGVWTFRGGLVLWWIRLVSKNPDS